MNVSSASRALVRVLLWGVVLLQPIGLAAQATRVAGRVLADDTGEPLEGVQIVVKGTTVGTLTDGSGNYEIRVPAGATTLAFSFIGYRTVEAPIAGPILNVTLEREAIGLEGITVTALGITREKRSLGYSVQDVSGDEITAVPEPNIVDALQGTVAGVNITSTNVPGGSSRIVLRGARSLTSNNQPLFILDGVPIDNSAWASRGRGNLLGGNYDYGNNAADIDPNIIESVSVLKGPNAAALYGSRAANGAIVITTKRGNRGGGRGLTVSTGTTVETPLRLPSYQNLYGQGFNGQFEWGDGAGGGLWDFVDESWGPRLDGRLICQFTSPGAGTDDCQPTPWIPHPANVRAFFDTGVTTNMTASLARTDEWSDVRLSATSSKMAGMYPGNRIDRMSASLSGGVELTERLSAEGSVNYMQNKGWNRPGTGHSTINTMLQFIWFGRQVDVNSLRDYRCAPNDTRGPCLLGNTFYNWNYNYYDNPFSMARENRSWDTMDRLIGHLAVTWAPADWLSATLRTGTDYSDDKRKRTVAWGQRSASAGKGSFEEETILTQETNTEILLTVKRSLAQDLFLTLNAGANRREEELKFNWIMASELVSPGIYSVLNAPAGAISNYGWTQRRRVNSVYGSANLNLREFLSVDVTGRNDWSSTLPAGHRSYFYPSVSAAFVFTDALALEVPFLSSGKVRASWTRVGSDADPYQTAAVFETGYGWGDIPGFTVPNTTNNAGLKPEETTAWEVGTDLGFLNERLGFVATYYRSGTVNQIMYVDVSPTTGFGTRILNAGDIRNWGTELMVRATPVRLRDGLRWDMTLNWARNHNEVVELYGDLETLTLAGTYGVSIEARKGEPFGTMYGNGYLRDDSTGKILVSDAGMPLRDPNRKVLGNYNPDWTAGLLNRFSYGDWDLSVLFDMKQGGNVFSITNYRGNYTGTLKASLRGRENGLCDPGIVVDGIRKSDGLPNTETVCPQDYFHSIGQIPESAIFDASYVKLREVALGYRVPTSIADRLGVASASLSLVGRNLFLWADAPNIDPETTFSTTNVQGLEGGQFPTGRSIGLTLTVRF